MTYIKCSLFGGILDTTAAKNVGQWLSNFQVVIAGSDIYVSTAPSTPAGFVTAYHFANATINAPSGYMGVQTFPQSQPYDPSVCAAACSAKSVYDTKYGLPSMAKPDICNFFVAYVLYKNNANGVFTCTYYTSAWDSTYAQNVGQYDQAGNHYTIGHAYGFPVANAPLNGAPVCGAQYCSNPPAATAAAAASSDCSSYLLQTVMATPVYVILK